MAPRKEQQVQYNLKVSRRVYDELRQMAEEQGTTIADIMRRGIKWQLLLEQVREKNGRVLLQKEAGEEPVEVLLDV